MNCFVFLVIGSVIYILVAYISFHMKDSIHTRNFYMMENTVYGSTDYSFYHKREEIISHMLELPPVYKTILELSENGDIFGRRFIQILLYVLRKGLRRRLLMPIIKMLVMAFKVIQPLKDAMLLLKHTARYDLNLRVEFLDNNLDDDSDEEWLWD